MRDLEYALGIDQDGDGAITWGELRARHADIAAYALARLRLAANGNDCALEPPALLVDEHSDGAYAVLRFSANCRAGTVATVDVDYRLFFDLDPTHRGLLRIEHAGGALAGVLSPERPRQSFVLADVSSWSQLLDYLREGVWHIWIGFDHILFLLSLLLPAVLAGGALGRPFSQPALRFAPVFWDVFRIVTAFTVAHSITLSLAALAVISLPSRLVESAIALSVMLAALNNMFPVVSRARWMVAFGFGLIHGFGFASVLADLGLPGLAASPSWASIWGRSGQLAIVTLFLPLAYALRRTWLYRRWCSPGVRRPSHCWRVWLLERALDLKLLPALSVPPRLVLYNLRSPHHPSLHSTEHAYHSTSTSGLPTAKITVNGTIPSTCRTIRSSPSSGRWHGCGHYPVMLKVVDAAVAKRTAAGRSCGWKFSPAKSCKVYGENVWLTGDARGRGNTSRSGPLTTPVGGGIRSIGVALRGELDLYVCLRPIRYFRRAQPAQGTEKTDMVIFRENAEDIYADIEWAANTRGEGDRLPDQ